MQKIATEMSISETSYVQQLSKDDNFQSGKTAISEP